MPDFLDEEPPQPWTLVRGFVVRTQGGIRSGKSLEVRTGFMEAEGQRSCDGGAGAGFNAKKKHRTWRWKPCFVSSLKRRPRHGSGTASTSSNSLGSDQDE
ncbi:MAG: hypothetical protein AB8H86_31985 [Polyangiales bacterium]